MSADPTPDRLAVLAAEEVLRLIFGEDFQGCTVSLDQVTSVINTVMETRTEQEREVVGLYEKIIEALHLLSTPPDRSKIATPEELQALLSERLDSIHTLTTKTMETLTLLKAQRRGDEPQVS